MLKDVTERRGESRLVEAVDLGECQWHGAMENLQHPLSKLQHPSSNIQ
jgi:hypothetical protein